MVEVDKETIERIKMIDSQIKEKLIENAKSSGIEQHEKFGYDLEDEDACGVPPEWLRLSEFEDRYDNATSYTITSVWLDWDDEKLPIVRYSIYEVYRTHEWDDYKPYRDVDLRIDEILKDDVLTKYVDWFDLYGALSTVLDVISNNECDEIDWEYNADGSKKRPKEIIY